MSIRSVIKHIPNIPKIWGEGALFAFSGIDGQTNVSSRFVATFAAERYRLLIHTPRRCVLDMIPDTPGTVIAATGDVLVADTSLGELAVTFSAWHSIIGVLPENTRLELRFESDPQPNVNESNPCKMDSQNQDVIVLASDGKRFSLSYGDSMDQARTRAEQGLETNIAGEISNRLAIYEDMPSLESPEEALLLKKCISVMKVNTLSPEGVIQQMWSTPDRVPHRHMWLWDSVFHSFGMNYVNPEISWQFLQSVLERQQEDGMIPHCMHVDGEVSPITQPPILAWGVWTNYQYSEDRKKLEYALPHLEGYLEWNLEHRDRNENGLLEWFIQDSETCRSGESGMDNSPRFDQAIILDAVDFSTFQAQDMQFTARIARKVGDREKATMWEERASSISQKIHGSLWDEEDGFYYDRDMAGKFSRVKAVSGLLPLLLDDIPSANVNRLLSVLLDAEAMSTAFPIPSVAANDPAWSTDMWRGATWVNLNFLITEGLLRHNKHREAQALVQKTLRYVSKYYERYGVLFEFYDAKDSMPPPDCDRKGKRQEFYDIRAKVDSIRDYHWTAALVACWLFRKIHRDRAL